VAGELLSPNGEEKLSRGGKVGQEEGRHSPCNVPVGRAMFGIGQKKKAGGGGDKPTNLQEKKDQGVEGKTKSAAE